MMNLAALTILQNGVATTTLARRVQALRGRNGAAPSTVSSSTAAVQAVEPPSPRRPDESVRAHLKRTFRG